MIVSLANTDTFDLWRYKTNQIIGVINSLTDGILYTNGSIIFTNTAFSMNITGNLIANGIFINKVGGNTINLPSSNASVNTLFITGSGDRLIMSSGNIIANKITTNISNSTIINANSGNFSGNISASVVNVSNIIATTGNIVTLKSNTANILNLISNTANITTLVGNTANFRGRVSGANALSSLDLVNLGQFPFTGGFPGTFQLPNGIIIKMGLGSITGGVMTSIFATPFPNNLFLVVPFFLTSGTATKNALMMGSSSNTTQAVIYGSSSESGATIYYVAIGN